MNSTNKIKELKRELTNLQEKLRLKNIYIDSLHWVWCSGGCEGGVHRFTPNNLTEEVVLAAENNTVRLRMWFDNKNFREQYKQMTLTEKKEWMKSVQDGTGHKEIKKLKIRPL